MTELNSFHSGDRMPNGSNHSCNRPFDFVDVMRDSKVGNNNHQPHTMALIFDAHNESAAPMLIDFNAMPDIYGNNNRFEGHGSNSRYERQQYDRQQLEMRQMLQAIAPMLQSLERMFVEMARMLAQNNQPERPSNPTTAPDTTPRNHNSDHNTQKPDGDQHSTKPPGQKPDHRGSTTKPPETDHNDKPAQNSNQHNDGSKDNGATKPENNGTSNDRSNQTNGKYADTGIQRGRTIYRNDFNGKLGEKPDQSVFDTAHIGADGKTRQRGPSIDEDAIIDTKNTVMDGNGHLQLFPEKERTYDPVNREYVDYTKGSFNTTKGLNFNLKDYPNGIAIEVRAKHPTATGSKFDALWLMTDHWTADPAKGEKPRDTIEYDAAEGNAGITVHYPYKTASGETKDIFGGGKKTHFDDGQFHTYTVVITPNAKTGKGDVVQYVDGKKEFEKADIFPADKDIHLRASLEVSPKWTHETYKGQGGMNSDASGIIDYLDVSELKPR